MISKLLLATSALGALSAPVANYQHTTQDGNVNITYQYETNEVNSIDDFVVGNVYHLSIPNIGLMPSDFLSDNNGYFDFYLVNGSISFDYSDNSIDENYNPTTISAITRIYFDYYDTLSVYTDYEEIQFQGLSYYDCVFSPISCDIVIVEYSNLNINVPLYFSSSDYNVITNVQEVYHTGLFGNLADFLRYHIYGGIPHVTDISFEVGNQTITMLDWLVTTTSIALAILCIFLLYHFFRWVFKLVSGLILLR